MGSPPGELGAGWVPAGPGAPGEQLVPVSFGATRPGRDNGAMPPPLRKTARSAREVSFEAAGLRALRAAGARVPEVLEAGERHLVLERVAAGGRASADDEERFGRELATLHRTTGPHFGTVDGDPQGYLGLCRIDLTPSSTWAESYLDRRVRPLTREAVHRGELDPSALRLVDRLGSEHLAPPEPPTLVHGDLWAGNRLVDRHGDSWLIDPSAQWGHREVDLAMMLLFGGFGEPAFTAYEDVLPLAEGWRDRVPVHQLAPLLVHAILFGGGYGQHAMTALHRALAAG